jgi:hypothetical protein
MAMMWGFTALAVPIIIHLWQRRKVIKVRFSTLRFLRLVAAKTSRSAKIENLLLLLLRCAIVALVAWAALKPAIETSNSKLLGGNVPRTIVLVIDQSLSMTYRSGEGTRLDRAKEQAKVVLAGLKEGDAVAVFGVSDRAKAVIVEPTVEHGAVTQAIDALQPTEARTDLGAGLREARKALAKATGPKQIFLFTDNQEGAWQFDRAVVFDEQWKQMEPKLVVVQPDDLSAVNAAVTRVVFANPFAAAGAMARGVATVENFSPAPMQDVLEIRAGNEKLAQRPVEVAAQSAVEVPFEFTVPTLADRWLQGTVALAGDHLAGDDRRYFLLSVYQPPKVLIVEQGSGPEKARSGFFLRKALTAGAQSAPVKTVTPGELDDLPVDSFSAVFLAGLSQVSDRSAVRLERYLQGGGTVVFFPSDQTDLANASKLEWLPAKPGAMRQVPAGRLVAFAVEPQHPLFTNSWDANTPFPALPQRKLLDWKLGAEGRVLLTLGEQWPFLIFGQRGPGRVLIVNASPDRAWGDFPLTSAFLPLVQQIARLSVARTGRASDPLIGDAVTAPPTVPGDVVLALKGPRGDVTPVQPGAPLLDRAEAAGFYEVTAGAEGLVHRFAVNVDGKEAQLAVISEDALTKIVPHETAVGLDGLRAWMEKARGGAPLWPVLLLLALLVYAFESVFSNVLARRRAQGDETHIATGRLNKRRSGQPFKAEPKPEEVR